MNLKIGDKIYTKYGGKNDYRIIYSIVNDKYYFQYQSGGISSMAFDKEMIEKYFNLDNSIRIKEKLGVK